MPREFELRKEVELSATPEQVWAAITTEAGMSAWFMPMADVTRDGPGVTAWDPGHHLTVTTPTGEDGSTHAFEYLIEARDGGSTVLRFVHSGILGEDWNTEYEGMTNLGWDMYLHTLAEYFTHFAGRTATYVHADGPAASAAGDAWPVLLDRLGITSAPARGERVRLTPDGLAAIDGVADWASPAFVGVRTDDALYRFHDRAALGMPIAVGHHVYDTTVDGRVAAKLWHTWLHRTFA